ncbi:MAG TPA: MBL fold metallo-hydrolase, partial [Chloroflexota bacterium]|nr:MBL fold metallo-hydrolase [Chloroflexota bacterium]
MFWSEVASGVWLFRDSCNVYALSGPEGLLIVNAGTGRWLQHLDELPASPAALACTHYFRDHSAGARAAADAGIPVYVPAGERAIFTDPVQHFRQRETYIIYDNLWDLYAPIEGVPVAGTLQDYDRTTLAGITVDVIPLPGVTITQIGLGFTLPDGRRAVFCGEAIHSPGRIARVAPLQYNYNDLSGAVQCRFSTRLLRDDRSDLLLPSLGHPILDRADEAIALLEENLQRLVAVRGHDLEAITRPLPLQRVTDHVWLDPRSVANTWYLISESGKALAIDYGYNTITCGSWPGYPKPERRRALLHGLDGLKQQLGIDRVDVVLVSHFHDDHVCGIPVLQRLHDTQCWAAENFADLLEHPEAHCFPCNWPMPSRVDRRLRLDEPFTWEEYTFQLHPMSGHTRFAALIGFEADGRRFAHTGDQYFFDKSFENNSFANNSRFQNHVYRNGALLNGYAQSGEWMLAWRPEVVLQGHQPAMFTDDAFFEHIAAWNRDYADLHRQIMPLGDDETHFDLDSWGGWIWPYRT